MSDWPMLYSQENIAAKGLLQNTVFRLKQKFCALKKLSGTIKTTVLDNFFFDLIF